MAAVISMFNATLFCICSRGNSPAHKSFWPMTTHLTRSVVSGEVAALEQFASFVAVEKLGRCRRLAVAGPWHSPLMAQTQREFSSWLDTVEFRAPRTPLIFNVTAAPENDPQKIRRLIARNLVEPVRWRTAMAIVAWRRRIVVVRGWAGACAVLSGAGQRFWQRDKHLQHQQSARH
jgi:hypothetical protein